MIISFELNGKNVYIDANPGERLVHILRRRFGLTGTKESCLSGRCGSCMVLLDGIPVPSCVIPVFQARAARVVTIEHFRETPECGDILEGFGEAGVTTCGFCDAGKLLVAHRILELSPRPSKDEIRRMYAGNVCRCTSLDELVSGVRAAAQARRRRLDAK